MNLNELYAKISRDFWKAEQVASWVERHFLHRRHFQGGGVVDISNYTLTVPYSGTPVMLAGDQTVTGTKTFSANVIAGVVRRANETGDLTLMGGTSVTQGPYIWLVGKDAGGSVDGAISYVSSTESSALGDHIFYVHNGTSDVEILRLTAAGDLVLPDAGLNYVRLNNTTGTIAITAATATTDGPYVAVVGKDQGGSEDGTVQIVGTTESSALGDIIFFIYDGANFNEKARIRASDSLLLIPGGINFGSSTLKNFTTGTWTPVIGGSALNPTLTYTAQSGNYQRIGNWVIFSCSVTINTISAGGSGDIRVTLPVTASDFDLITVSVSGIDLPGTPASLVGVTLGGAANFVLSCVNDNGATATVQHTGLANGDAITATGVYRVA